MTISRGNLDQTEKLESLLRKIIVKGDEHTQVNRLTSLIRIVSEAYKDHPDQMEPYFTNQDLIKQFPFAAGFANYLNLKLGSDLVNVYIDQQLGEIPEPERIRKFHAYEVFLYFTLARLFYEEQCKRAVQNLANEFLGVPALYREDKVNPRTLH